MKKKILFLFSFSLYLSSSFIFFSKSDREVLEKRNNPADRKADNFQGYETENSIQKVFVLNSEALSNGLTTLVSFSNFGWRPVKYVAYYTGYSSDNLLEMKSRLYFFEIENRTGWHYITSRFILYDNSKQEVETAIYYTKGHTVTFDKNDINVLGTMIPMKAGEGVSISLTINSFTRAGYYFAGWATTSGGPVVYPDGAIYIMGSVDNILYAKWIANPSFTITFDKNDALATGTMSDQLIQSGLSANLNTCEFTKTGYFFAGWAKIASGAVMYANGANYIMGSSNVTLYATWTIDSLASITKREVVIVPGGTYTQIDATGISFAHTISSFQMAQYEVTYELWYAVRAWATNNSYYFDNAGREGQDGTNGAAPTVVAKFEPVTSITWRDIIVWCNAYSEMSGKLGVYFSDSGYISTIKDSRDGSYGNSINPTLGSFDYPYVKWSANGFRLPTEGEWQYAASYKDGISWTPYDYFSGATGDYNDVVACQTVAWYAATAGGKTQEVGVKIPNSLGIYDMSGNAWEWCWDWYASSTSIAKSNDRGPGSGTGRLLRGGGWASGASSLRIGDRGHDTPFIAYYLFGFRVVSTIP